MRRSSGRGRRRGGIWLTVFFEVVAVRGGRGETEGGEGIEGIYEGYGV